jgi:hypothetical protein
MPLVRDSLLHRARAKLWHRWLDQRIAQGDDPAGSAALATRARQLTSRRMRGKLVAAIEDLVATVEDPALFSPRIGPEHEAVLAAREHLRQICAILESDEPVYARGVALTIALIRDPDSPLYIPAEVGSAWYWAQLATQALQGHV